jgi:hemoglobin
VVEDFMELEHTDPKVDFFRGGKRKLTDEQLTALKQSIVEFVSQAAGGPLKYTGKTMMEAHKGMGITNSQFDALVADLKQALNKNGAKPADRDALLAAVEGTRKDIVEEKKEGGKKEDKPAPKKEDGKTEPKKDEPKKGGVRVGPGDSVKGKVTLNGIPIAGAVITFKGQGGEGNLVAPTDKEGSYAIVDGVSKGDYVIFVTSPVNQVPVPYDSPKTSPLRAKIAAGRNNFDLNLISK